ncbi:type I-E CRISPR-associated protein Cse1/CasA [Paraliomyxa miuraensis]|uniref:type I-E CRISPR-associated protein Cse1/CasA n=1 Tax=Paraliomyxa miuraensis TaxID=376150 RepID=UPI002258F7E2|nr:type I-E CRISPR-associated protein Cse1/CasA [Paraliomyxa miuraensis]MCX4244419.1 type I-E CRISPR-associated protein Cse1/CasA [Paraliomyxa miuraensis]
MSTDHDVLRERLITVLFDDGDERRHATLCEVLAWLSADRTISFAALQPHQRHPWHAFLVQLGAIALERAGQDELPTEASAWEELLLGLTDGAREPWCLVVEALDQPALLQPPVPEKKIGVLKNLVATPDALDILLTTRNFDVKGQRAVAGAAEHWLLALVAKQTFEGFGGAGNYGVLRMNGGFGNRPCMAFAPSSRWSDRFRRDVAVWLEQCGRLVDDYGYDPEGPALLWTLPWDGKACRSSRGLHPFFIESCRRIRLQSIEHGLVAHTGTSAKPRIDSSDSAGDTGDIWTPVQASSKKEGLAALTIASAGFNYRKLHEILFGDWQRPAALRLRPSDGDAPVVVAMALVRGQGKTDGYHERWIPIPAKTRRMLAQPDGGEHLGIRSKTQLDRASEAGRSVLKPAVCTLLQGAGDLDYTDKRVQPWLDRLDARIDDRFFAELFDTASLDTDAARVRWDRVLVALLRRTFLEALGETPIPDVHRYRTRAAAEGRFHAALRRSFPEATAAPQTTTEEQAHA